MTARLQIYDPPMCCPTGICGPTVDPELVRFAGDLKWLEDHGVTVARHNLAQEPAAFVENPVVLTALNSEGTESLPIIVIDDKRVDGSGYPSRELLASLLGVDGGDCDD